MKSKLIPYAIRHLSGRKIIPRVCVVGAGPAGFYVAQHVIKILKDVKVDIVERLPVPFGLVRFGVAPDHPEVKNVINTFNKTLQNSNVEFLGNVNVGKDVTISQLRENYHAVILTYGAEEDRVLGIPGENLQNVVSGRRFVGWYNGIPSDKDLKVDLNVDEAVVLGQGNVAMDIARILLTPIDKLKKTDITEHALDQLSRSKVRKVTMVGRRGPLQAAFTIAELRELTKLENCRTLWRQEDFANVRKHVPDLARPRKRLTELMLKSMEDNASAGEKAFCPVFLRSPVEFLGTGSTERIRMSVNELVGDDVLRQTARATGKVEEWPCQLALRSIGYQSVQVDPHLPFDASRGRVTNVDGKIEAGLYAAGWVATGPVGVILSTMSNAFQVADLACRELRAEDDKAGAEGLVTLLEEKNVQLVGYEEWKKIDEVEQERGKVLGKPREKIVDVAEMLRVAAA